MADLWVDLASQRPDLRIEAGQHRRQRERALPVMFALGLQRAETGEGSMQVIHAGAFR